MGLKQIDKIGRIVFLSMFAEEMFRNFVKKYESKKKIEFEKVKDKILEPIPENVSVLKKKDSSDSEEKVVEVKPVKFAYHEEAEKKKRKVPIHFTKGVDKSVPLKTNFLAGKKQGIKSANVQSGMQSINNLLRDKAIQFIECPGPGKNLVVKKNNRINVTKMVFGPVQIQEVIGYFSTQARIPVIQGILKAAVGDLIISAVSSKFVGSRFIITRNTPYSLIDRNKRIVNI